MKHIRNFAATLLIITSILHALPAFTVTEDPNAMPMLAFGVAYFIIGFLLFVNKSISYILGIIFPVIGLLVGFFVIGYRNWDNMLIAMFLIDGIVILCCIFLLVDRAKLKSLS